MKISVSKREKITYVIILMWLFMGILATMNKIGLIDLSAYFISMTGFVGVYIWSETVKSSGDPTHPLPKSKREKMIYWCVALWFVSGIVGIEFGVPLTELGTYFGALTPFIGSYMIGVTKRGTNVDAVTGNTPPANETSQEGVVEETKEES